MKLSYRPYLFTLSLFSILITDLFAQQWVGLQHINYQYSNDQFETTMTDESGTDILTLTRHINKALSAGAHFRLLGENDNYQQFELLFTHGSVKETSRHREVGNTGFSPSLGSELQTTRVGFGYRRGKLYTLKDRLRCDIGLSVFAGWKNVSKLPIGTNNRFLVYHNGLSSVVNAHVGLNYQLHPRINIGYDMVPFAFDIFAYEKTVEEPLFMERWKQDNGLDVSVLTFPNVLSWQNFRISYCLN